MENIIERTQAKSKVTMKMKMDLEAIINNIEVQYFSFTKDMQQ